MSNYAAIIQQNLGQLYAESIATLEKHLPCTAEGDQLLLEAFGGACRISPRGVFLNGKPEEGPRGVVISLYALHNAPDKPVLEPFVAFKQLPDSGPYAGAFARNAESILAAQTGRIEAGRSAILGALKGSDTSGPDGADFSFQFWPLPKIALRYIFYRADEEFPASATCLFSHNAVCFLPVDGLADLAEYSSRKILELAN